MGGAEEGPCGKNLVKQRPPLRCRERRVDPRATAKHGKLCDVKSRSYGAGRVALCHYEIDEETPAYLDAGDEKEYTQTGWQKTVTSKYVRYGDGTWGYDTEQAWTANAPSAEAQTKREHNHIPFEKSLNDGTKATCTEDGKTSTVVCGHPRCQEIVKSPEPIDKLDHTPGEAVRENEVPAQVGVAGSYDEVVYCSECGDEISREAHTIDALPTPPVAVVPGDDVVVDEDPGTEIDDPAVPLASGPVTRAQFIDYLWRHEGEPASGGACAFTDVPEDHEYVLALTWAEQNGVAVAYDDGSFEPDELVTVAGFEPTTFGL